MRNLEEKKVTKLPNRKSIRLKNYDYSSNGYYFVTICTQNREKLFGEIVGATLRGRPKRYLYINLKFGHPYFQNNPFFPLDLPAAASPLNYCLYYY